MRSSLYLLFLFAIGCCAKVTVPPPKVAAEVIAANQLKAFEAALKAKDKETLFKLFNANDKDLSDINQALSNFKGAVMTAGSATYTDEFGIEANYIFARNKKEWAVEWILVKNHLSPTGWKVNGIRIGNKDIRGMIGVELLSCWGDLFRCICNTLADIFGK